MQLETKEISATLYDLADAYRFAPHHCALLRRAAERLDAQTVQLIGLRAQLEGAGVAKEADKSRESPERAGSLFDQGSLP